MLLDALGTLVRLEPPGPHLRRELRERFALEVTAAEADAAIAAEIAYYRAHNLRGRDRAALAGLRRACATVLRDALPPAAAEVPVGELLDALLAALRFRAFPEVPHALAALREEGLRLVVVSNWDVSLHGMLAETGLARYMNGAISSAELGAEKPAAAIFQHALTLAGVPAGAALHVGDSLREDVEGARAAGITPVFVSRDGGGDGPPGVCTVRSLAELPALAF